METKDVRFEIEEQCEGRWVPCATHEELSLALGYCHTHRRLYPRVDLRVVRVDQVITEQRTVVEGGDE